MLYASLKPVVAQAECPRFSPSRPGVFHILVGTQVVKSVTDMTPAHICVTRSGSSAVRNPSTNTTRSLHVQKK